VAVVAVALAHPSSAKVQVGSGDTPIYNSRLKVRRLVVKWRISPNFGGGGGGGADPGANGW
jgi:hypothetical protein